MAHARDWSLGENDARRVDDLLRELLADTGAHHALLIDRTGQLVTVAGAGEAFDPTAFASLAAADFAANEQLAAMLGESNFTSLSHQGANDSAYLVDVARRAILAIVFGRGVTLGLVRIRARRTVPELNALLEEVFSRTLPRGRRHGLDEEWATDAADEVDRVFGGW